MSVCLGLVFPQEKSPSRLNPLGIQMIPEELHSMLFPSNSMLDSIDNERIELSKQHLSRFELLNKNLKPAPPVVLDKLMPPLVRLKNQQSPSIEAHFQALGLEQQEPYFSLAQSFAKASLPPMPTKWKLQEGWTRYNSGSVTMEKVDFPDEKALVLDTEVMYKLSPFPVLAVAVSPTNWYTWLCPSLLKKTKIPPKDLISLGPCQNSKIIVGHHVAFDRARLKEEYQIQGTQSAFLDTMSLHSTIGGLSSQQRGSWLKYKRLKEKQRGSEEELESTKKAWMDVGSANNLKDIFKLYTGKSMDKEMRSFFDSVDMDSIRDPEILQDLITYCAKDVLATHELFSILLPKFLDKCPHPVSFAGMLHMGKGYLPVTTEWISFIDHAEAKCRSFQESIEEKLKILARKALEDPVGSQKDAWLSNLDWDVIPPARGKPLPFDPKKTGFASKKELALAPKWYKDLWDSKIKNIRLSTIKRVTPYLLKLQWKGYPVYHTTEYGWLFRVPKEEPQENYGNLIPNEAINQPNRDLYGYYRIPHPEGEGKNCGNPLAKSYLAAFEDGVLTSKYDDAKQILTLNAQCSYWVSARQRIMEQFVVWNDDGKVIGPVEGPDGHKVGVILPQSITMGTVTRRAVEATWMTAANAKANRIGSELKSLIRAPKGYIFVGADVDSQELWIASLLGDAQFGFHGASAIGFMTLQGTKALKTDLHSVTGSIIGVSRDSAKVFNYSRIYGTFAFDSIYKWTKDLIAYQ